jgi:hypothetical protein
MQSRPPRWMITVEKGAGPGSPGPSAAPGLGWAVGWVGGRVVVVGRSSSGRRGGQRPGETSRSPRRCVGSSRLSALRRARSSQVSVGRGCVVAARRPRGGEPGSRHPWLSRRGRAEPASSGSGRAPDPWPAGSRPQVEEVHDVDDWLAVIATGRCVGVTAESTLVQYRRRALSSAGYVTHPGGQFSSSGSETTHTPRPPTSSACSVGSTAALDIGRCSSGPPAGT